MVKKHTQIFFLSCILFSCAGCNNSKDRVFSPDSYVDNRENEILILDDSFMENVPEEYSFMILTDIHFGSKRLDAPPIDLSPFFLWLENLSDEDMPRFCLVLGDIADRGTQQQFDEYKEFEGVLENKNIKIFHVVGNHDIYEGNWDNWKKNCYPFTSFYKFNTKKFSFYALDSASGTFGGKQFQIFKKYLNADPNPKVVFTHYPIYTKDNFFGMTDSAQRNLIISCFAQNNVKIVFGGHLHWFEKYDYGRFQTYALPSFRFMKQWTIVRINESTQEYELKLLPQYKE